MILTTQITVKIITIHLSKNSSSIFGSTFNYSFQPYPVQAYLQILRTKPMKQKPEVCIVKYWVLDIHLGLITLYTFPLLPTKEIIFSIHFFLTLGAVILRYCPVKLCGWKEGMCLIPMEGFRNVDLKRLAGTLSE